MITISLRWLIAFVTFWLVCTLISNTIEGSDVYTAEQVAQIQAYRGQTVTEQKEAGVGALTTTGMNPATVINAVYKSLTLEYSFLYDIDYTKTQVQCEAISNADWQPATSSCKVPNVWYLPFLLLLWGPIVGVSIFLVLTLWHAIRGGGT
ncbi:MAG: hypothetical protein PHQ22_10660 [Sulfuricurvum sp.]|nr:hypothetical protein [Sulfuricurvum sp.]